MVFQPVRSTKPVTTQLARRRSTRRRRRHVKKKSGIDWGGAAKTALGIGKFLLSVLNVEYKFYDASLSSSGSSIVWLTSIPEGIGANQRNGQSILAKSLQLRWRVRPQTSWTPIVTSIVQTYRFIVFIDFNDDGGTPTIDGTANPDSGVLTADNPIANMSMNVPGRYQILHDSMGELNFPYERAMVIKEDFKELHHHIKYQVNSTQPIPVQGEQRTGNIYMLFTTQQNYPDPGSASYPLAYDFQSRVRFVDN